MNTPILKYTIAILLLISVQTFAQDFQGVATYQTKSTLDIDFSKANIPADRLRRMKEMMKNRLEKTYKLTFNKTESIYKEERKLESGSGRRGMRMMMIGGNATGDHYKNIQTKKSTKENEFSGKMFLVKDDLTNYQWKMEQETKTIGNYTCFKATAVVKMPAPRSFTPRSRRDMSEEDRKKEDEKLLNPELVDTVITAWYTLDIPIGNGPGDYYGLPGLILELSYANTNIMCTKITINPKEKVEIKEPKKGKQVSQVEYDKIVQQKMSEMRERMSNEREKGIQGGSHRMRIGG